jgi:cytochrome b561
MNQANKIPDKRYFLSRLFHWAMVVIFFILAFASDALMSRVNNADERIFVYNLHVSLGLLFTLILILRLFWLLHYREIQAEFDSHWQKVAAYSNYCILYLLMFLLISTGTATVMGSGKALQFFDLVSIPYVDSFYNVDVKYYAKESHHYLVNSSYFFLCLHILGAITHYQKPLFDKLKTKLGLKF